MVTHHDIDADRQTIVGVVATSFDYQRLTETDTPTAIIEQIQQRDSLFTRGAARVVSLVAYLAGKSEGSCRRAITQGGPTLPAGPARYHPIRLHTSSVCMSLRTKAILFYLAASRHVSRIHRGFNQRAYVVSVGGGGVGNHHVRVRNVGVRPEMPSLWPQGDQPTASMAARLSVDGPERCVSPALPMVRI